MTVQWGRTTALFGGTFDPPHSGHLEAVNGLFGLPGVARVVVVPSASPPHKPGVTAASKRLEMTRLAFSSRRFAGEVSVDDCEIERAVRTGQPSYSFDTIRELSQR